MVAEGRVKYCRILLSYVCLKAMGIVILAGAPSLAEERGDDLATAAYKEGRFGEAAELSREVKPQIHRKKYLHKTNSLK